MKEKEVYGTKSLSEWEFQKQMELNHRNRKMNQQKKIFLFILIGSVFILILVPYLCFKIGSDTYMTVIAEFLFIIILFVLNRSSYKEYQRQKQMYNTLEDSINLRSDVQRAVDVQKAVLGIKE